MPTEKRTAETSRPARAARGRARETSKSFDSKKVKTEGVAARPRPATRERRATVAVVGAGRLGSALAHALDSCGYQVTALVSRARARARRAARRLARSRPLALSSGELDRLPDSDLLVIATPDDQIEATAARISASLLEEERAAVRQLANAEVIARGSPTAAGAASRPPSRTPRKSRVALHASGALSSDSLDALRARGFAVGSLHPLVSVSDPETALENLRGAFYCVEGDAQAVRLARRIVRSLGGRSFSISARDKALYHAAAVLAAGHAVALFDLAAESLSACGLTRARARAVLLPLARSTLSNLAAAPENAAALTGPFARADAETVRRNLSALAGRGLRTAEAAYALLGLASLDLAEQSGADPASLTEIARMLSEADAEGDG